MMTEMLKQVEKKHTWKSLQHRFPKIKDRNYIQRFRKHLDNLYIYKEECPSVCLFVRYAFKTVRANATKLSMNLLDI